MRLPKWDFLVHFSLAALALGAASREIQQWRKSILGFTSTAMIQVQGSGPTGWNRIYNIKVVCSSLFNNLFLVPQSNLLTLKTNIFPFQKGSLKTFISPSSKRNHFKRKLNHRCFFGRSVQYSQGDGLIICQTRSPDVDSWQVMIYKTRMMHKLEFIFSNNSRHWNFQQYSFLSQIVVTLVLISPLNKIVLRKIWSWSLWYHCSSIFLTHRKIYVLVFRQLLLVSF